LKKYLLTSIAIIIALIIYILIRVFSPSTDEIKKPTTKAPTISVQEKKANFRATIIPAVNKVYADLMEQYLAIDEAIKTDSNINFVELQQQYRATNNEELLLALKPHPQSIAIAQAALESSWATSRFFREANNVFGVWSFNADEPRIAAGNKRGDKTIWIKKYASVEDSVRDYYRTLARGRAFQEFRQLKMETNDPFELVKKLDRYSELGAKYGEELTAIIKFNKFDDYDKL